MRTIGIDFGTCNIKGAEKKKNGDVSALSLGKNVTNSTIIPNIILYEPDKDGERPYKTLIGNTAASKPVTAEQDKIRNIKLYLQKQAWSRELSFGKTVNAYEVTCDIMKSLYDTIHMANQKEELAVVVTVPVNFSRRQQLIVQKAAQEAGFLVRAIITEPFAAFFALMQDQMEEDHNVLIFDFGGGTMDLCLVKLYHAGSRTCIETQASVGISYGGNNISSDIINQILADRQPELIRGIMQEKPDADKKDQYQQKINQYYLLEAVEEMKPELFSGSEEGNVDTELMVMFYGGAEGNFGKIAVSDIYQMLERQNWKKRIYKLLDNLFSDSDELTADEVTDVFMVGGSSSIPFFRRILDDYFRTYGKKDADELFELNDDLDTDARIYASVSCGAAIYNGILTAKEDTVKIKNRIPFMIYTKGEAGSRNTPLTKNDAYRDYCSRLDLLEESMKEEKKIRVYQTIFGEEEKEVYLGDIELSQEIVQQASLYRLMIDRKGTIQAEIGSLDTQDEYGDEDDSFCVDWRCELKIDIA